MISHLNRLLCIAAVAAITGCVSTPPPIQEHYYWPPLPDRPYLEWTNAYQSQLDLGKSDFQRFKAAILGEDAPIKLVKPIEARSDAVNDKLYVADIGVPAVFVFDRKNNELRTLSAENAPPLSHPISMAFDEDNNLYVLERRFSNILVFAPNEKLLHSFTIQPFSKIPIAMAINKKTRRIYVSDGETNRINVLDYSGKLLFSFGKAGDKEGEFNMPVSIAVSGNGDLYVVDAFNARIQIFSPDGVYKRKIGRRGDGLADFQLIKAVAIDSDNNIYVAEGRTHQIKVFNTNGDLLLVFGDFYMVSSTGKRAPGGFAVPVSMDIDAKDRLYVVDQLNARIQAFQYMSDEYLKTHPIK